MAVVANLRRAGASGDSGQSIDLALKDFEGRVLMAYAEGLSLDQYHETMNLGGGASSWQFPVMGEGTATYHEAGADLFLDNDAAGNAYNNAVPMGERLIHADNELVSSQFVAKLDEKILHYDYRSRLATMLGRAIRKRSEQQKFRVAYKSCGIAADALFTGSKGGTTIVNNASDTDPEQFVSELFVAQQTLDEKEVPEEGRVAWITPAQNRLLFAKGDGTIPQLEWVNKDFGGTGAIATGRVPMIAGFEIAKSNYMPIAAGTYGDVHNRFDTAGSPTGNDYTLTIGSGNDTAAICMQRELFGTVSLEGIMINIDWVPWRRGYLVQVAKCEGSGTLRPECGVLIRAGT